MWLPFEKFRDVKKRYKETGHEENAHDAIHSSGAGSPRSSKDKPHLVPWDVTGDEYELLKKSCCDPSVRLVDTHGY
jgi:hypothetical protein